VFLSALHLYDFRNYARLELSLDYPLALLVGGNAQGKTNLLEGICVAALTRSPRTSSGHDLIRFGARAARVALELRDDDRRNTLEARLLMAPEGNRVSKEFRLNDHPIAAQRAVGTLRVVPFWPDDLQALKGGGEGRRRLLDGVLSQVDRRYGRQLSQYEHILEQRNALLRRVREGTELAWSLGHWTRTLAQAASPVIRARLRHLRRLKPLVEAQYAALSGEVARLEVSYEAKRYQVSEEMAEDEAMPDSDGAENLDPVAGTLQRALEGAAEEELARAVTVAGPHRDDLRVELGGREARIFASQGQQRSAVLSWKLAEVAYITTQTGSPPLLLLDDVLSELDRARRTALLAALEGGSQALVTACERSDLPEGWLRRARRFRVEAGSVRLDGDP
jgi:DNA replication and repair protein RecF